MKKVGAVLEQLAGNPTWASTAVVNAVLLQSHTELHRVTARLLQDDAAKIKPEKQFSSSGGWRSMTGPLQPAQTAWWRGGSNMSKDKAEL